MTKVTVTQAAKVMGCSPQFIRIGMQRKLLDIGTALKTSRKWTYNISPGLLAERQRMSLSELEEAIKE